MWQEKAEKTAEKLDATVAKSEKSGIISFDKGVTQEVQKAFNSEFNKMQQKFGRISTISRVGTLIGTDSTYGEFYDHSGKLLLRFADRKNALSEHSQIALKMKKSGYWSSAHPLHTFRHEIGHAIQLEHKMNDSLWNDKLRKIIDIMDNINQSDISLYGLTTLDEFISECIAESMTKKPRNISKQVANIVIGG